MPYVTCDDVATQDIIDDFSEEEFADPEEEMAFLKESIQRDLARYKELKSQQKGKAPVQKYTLEEVKALLASQALGRDAKRPKLERSNAVASILSCNQDIKDLEDMNKI